MHCFTNDFVKNTVHWQSDTVGIILLKTEIAMTRFYKYKQPYKITKIQSRLISMKHYHIQELQFP